MQTKRNYSVFFHLDNKNKQCFLSPFSVHTCVILRTWQEFSYLFYSRQNLLSIKAVFYRNHLQIQYSCILKMAIRMHLLFSCAALCILVLQNANAASINPFLEQVVS